MRQIIQNVRNGQLEVAELPCPAVKPGHILVANRCSVISAGTERTARELAQKSLLAKARERPDHVRRVVEKIRQEGVVETIRQVRAKLDQPMTMGYSSSGVVIACGDSVQEFKPGDRVASNAPHAEFSCVSKNLAAHIPDAVPFDHGAFAVLGAIAMQGIRQSRATIGETAFVIGLGLIGQLTVSLLKAAGVRVIATDLDSARCALALQMAADVARPRLAADDIEAMTGGLGADVVLITASSKSNAPVDLAANAVRQRGRIVLVGVVDLQLDRRPFYFKEAEFVVSCSYGPGRYDPHYEELGQDYPAGYVRWTEQRNIQSVLELMGAGRLDIAPLISHRFEISEAERAYELIEKGDESYVGVVLDYADAALEPRQRIELNPPNLVRKTNAVGIGCLGVGNFASSVLLPKLCRLRSVHPEVICSTGGLSAAHTGSKLGFRTATTNASDVLQNDAVDAVIVATRPELHARQVIAGMRAGKHVFVEKPLCLSIDEFAEVEQALIDNQANRRHLMVGFNRRFSPAAQAVRSFFENCLQPLTVSVRFNPGSIPSDHWVHDESIGGGRIIGEACHAIDLATFLTNSPVVRVFAESIGSSQGPEITDDQCFITLRHADGSVSSVAYLAGGDRSCPKERVEVFGGGRTAIIDDFRQAEGWHGSRRRKLWRGTQDKGHNAELVAFLDAIQNGEASPISWEQLAATSLASILAVRSIREGGPMEVPISANEPLNLIRKAG